jgi:hypothetical protein
MILHKLRMTPYSFAHGASRGKGIACLHPFDYRSGQAQGGRNDGKDDCVGILRRCQEFDSVELCGGFS